MLVEAPFGFTEREALFLLLSFNSGPLDWTEGAGLECLMGLCFSFLWSKVCLRHFDVLQAEMKESREGRQALTRTKERESGSQEEGLDSWMSSGISHRVGGSSGLVFFIEKKHEDIKQHS